MVPHSTHTLRTGLRDTARILRSGEHPGESSVEKAILEDMEQLAGDWHESSSLIHESLHCDYYAHGPVYCPLYWANPPETLEVRNWVREKASRKVFL